MLSLVVLCTAAAAAATNKAIDFRSLLELAQKPEHGNLKKVLQHYKYKNVPKDEYNSYYGSLKSHKILDLLQKVTHEKGLELQSDKSDYRDYGHSQKELDTRLKQNYLGSDFIFYDRYKDINENNVDDARLNEPMSNTNNYRNDDERDELNNKLALEELLMENVLSNNHEEKTRSKLTPNNLIGSFEANVSEDSKGAYTKVYVILNPKAIGKSSNKDELNNLLLKIFSLTGTSREKNKEYRYKGFPVTTGLYSRRARRDSRETYGGKEPIEDDYKPKRPRKELSGGGGGGRTAIPYIRHRGDIYERDN